MKNTKLKIWTMLALIVTSLLVSGCPRWWHRHPHPHRPPHRVPLAEYNQYSEVIIGPGLAQSGN